MEELYYKLVNRKAVVCTPVEWGKFLSDRGARKVGYTKVGGYAVSTVFLGLDHSFGRSKEPILFKTMIFDNDGSCEEYQTICSTWEEAEKMHAQGIAHVAMKRAEKFLKL